jgi:uncharacterized protein YecE (DUF72 family)
MALHVGTSGWAYAEWRGAFYPPRLPQKEFLSFYGEALNACEVNATFYRSQSASALERWAAAVPPSFRFTAKAHRRVTYRRQLVPDPQTEAFIREFVASLAPLGGRLGCLLLQLPEFIERDDGALAGLLDLMPEDLPVACEPLHASWQEPELAAVLAERALAAADELARELGVAACATPAELAAASDVLITMVADEAASMELYNRRGGLLDGLRQDAVALEMGTVSIEYVKALAAVLAERGGTLCVREKQGKAPSTLPPGPLAYVRLKGEHYGDEAVAALRDLFAREAAGRDVYVFARHKGVPADDPHTGLGLARALSP